MIQVLGCQRMDKQLAQFCMKLFVAGIRLKEESQNTERKQESMIIAMIAFAVVFYVVMSRLDRFLNRL